MEKVLEVLKPEYMSSEESDADDETPHKVSLVPRRFVFF